MTTRVSCRLILAVVAVVGLCLASSGLVATETIDVRLPADRTLEDAVDSPAVVVFRHTTHVARTGNDCLKCHPEPFSILGRHALLTHEEMDQGRACGACHDGQAAFATVDVETCDSCHVGEVDGRTLPDVRIVRSEDSPAAVTFRHSTHRQSECATCHPRPFAMKAGETRLSKDEMYEGATCGSCHDGTAAFAVDDTDRCETCHVGEEVGS